MRAIKTKKSLLHSLTLHSLSFYLIIYSHINSYGDLCSGVKRVVLDYFGSHMEEVLSCRMVMMLVVVAVAEVEDKHIPPVVEVVFGNRVVVAVVG